MPVLTPDREVPHGEDDGVDINGEEFTFHNVVDWEVVCVLGDTFHENGESPDDDVVPKGFIDHDVPDPHRFVGNWLEVSLGVNDPSFVRQFSRSSMRLVRIRALFLHCNTEKVSPTIVPVLPWGIIWFCSYENPPIIRQFPN